MAEENKKKEEEKFSEAEKTSEEKPDEKTESSAPEENKKEETQESKIEETKEGKEENSEKAAEDSSETKREEHKTETKEKPKEHKKHEHKHHKHHAAKHKSTKGVSPIWPVISAILVILLVIMIVANPFSGQANTQEKIGEAEAKLLAQEFVNTNLLQPGASASVTDIDEENGVYKIQLTIQGQQYDSYMTMDGKMFFPQAGIKMDEVAAQQPTQENTQPAAPDVPKSETPEIEMFVMSHCPFGTQIEKGMLPVVELLGDKADIQVKFVNYAMHGKEEVDEQLKQYCIQQEYPEQYYAYLQCFLQDSDGEACIQELGFDQTTLDTCIAATDEEYGIYADYEDKSTWSGGRFPRFAIHDEENQAYGVQGSPTLVVNGQKVSAQRDSESLKQIVCNAFEETPDECNTELPTTTPSAGFGFGTSGTDSAAANCVV